MSHSNKSAKNLVLRLRGSSPMRGTDLLLEAASEIERLERELNELRYAFDTNRDLTPAVEPTVRKRTCGGTGKVDMHYGDQGPDHHNQIEDCPGCKECIPVETSAESETIARAYLRLQAADVPRGPWHWEVSRMLSGERSAPETAACQHDLIAPNPTVVITGQYDGRCTVCGATWSFRDVTPAETTADWLCKYCGHWNAAAAHRCEFCPDGRQQVL